MHWNTGTSNLTISFTGQSRKVLLIKLKTPDRLVPIRLGATYV
jgi:hypothetical protein